MLSHAERSRIMIGAAALAAATAISLGGCDDEDPEATTAPGPQRLT